MRKVNWVVVKSPLLATGAEVIRDRRRWLQDPNFGAGAVCFRGGGGALGKPLRCRGGSDPPPPSDQGSPFRWESEPLPGILLSLYAHPSLYRDPGGPNLSPTISITTIFTSIYRLCFQWAPSEKQKRSTDIKSMDPLFFS